MKKLCLALCMLAFCVHQSSWASQRLEQVTSTANRVLAIGPNDDALVSYHPGRVSILSVLGPNNGRFFVLTALPLRGKFLVGPWNEKTLWVAFVPIDDCESDVRLLKISTAAAERSHRAQFLTTRGHLDSRAIDLSIHDHVNAQIGHMANRWGDLDQRSWPGVEVVDLPDSLCPSRWERDRLLLLGSEHATVFDPKYATGSRLQGSDWLFGQAGAVSHQGDESTLVANGTSVALPVHSNWRWIGLDETESALLWVEAEPEAALYRFRDDTLEVLFSQPGYHLADSQRMTTGKALSIGIYDAGSHPFDRLSQRQLYLDHKTSARIRSIERTTQQEHWLVTATTESAPLLTQTANHFWAIESTWSSSPVEGLMPWLDTTDFESRPLASVWIDGEWSQMQASEARGLEFLGIAVKAGSDRPANSCTWQRKQQNERSKTSVTCPWGSKLWSARLALESDARRLTRLQDIAAFILSSNRENND